MVLFDLNKLLDYFNTKLLGNLIESNSHEFFFSPSLLFLLQNLDYTHDTHFHIDKFIIYAIINVLNENIIIFYFIIIVMSLKS